MGNTSFILASIGVFLVVILLLVIILLVAKKYLSPSGNVNIVINGDKTINVPQGSSLMTTLNENGIFLPSACGGKASCGQCKVQVLEGGGGPTGVVGADRGPAGAARDAVGEHERDA